MNNTLRNNRDKFSSKAMSKIYQDFTATIIWQDESLNDYSDIELTYNALSMIHDTCNIFMSLVWTNDRATKQAVQHEINRSIGHDIALQLLRCGVGFWEQEESKLLDEILEFLKDTRALKNFRLFYDESENLLDWDLI